MGVNNTRKRPTTMPITAPVYLHNKCVDQLEFSKETTTLSSVLTTLSSLYEDSPFFDSPEYDLSLEYKDEEGDWVKVSCDQEWQLCLSTVKNDQLVLRIVVEEKRVIQNKFNQAYAHFREIGSSLLKNFAPVATASVDDDLIRLTTPSTPSNDVDLVDSVLSTDTQPVVSSDIDEEEEEEELQQQDDFEMINHSMLQSTTIVDEEQPIQLIEQPAFKYEEELKSLKDMGFNANE